MKKYLLLFFMMSIPFVLNAQVQVKGVVTASDNGQTLVGVSVMEQGTLNGVVTDLDGNYSIEVKSADAVLVFSSIGYKTTEVTVGSQSVIDVVMDVDQQLLDEVVVMGYSTKTRGEITSFSFLSISSIFIFSLLVSLKFFFITARLSYRGSIYGPIFSLASPGRNPIS